MGWLVGVLDNIMQATYAYDLVGNRRSTKAFVRTDTGFTQLTDENWYTYNEAGLVTLDRGDLSDDGAIVISAGKGTSLKYDTSGQRIEEHTLDKDGKAHVKTIHYQDAVFTGTDYDGTADIAVTTDDDGARTHYSSAKSGKASDTSYDAAGRLVHVLSLRAMDAKGDGE